MHVWFAALQIREILESTGSREHLLPDFVLNVPNGDIAEEDEPETRKHGHQHGRGARSKGCHGSRCPDCRRRSSSSSAKVKLNFAEDNTNSSGNPVVDASEIQNQPELCGSNLVGDNQQHVVSKDDEVDAVEKNVSRRTSGVAPLADFMGSAPLAEEEDIKYADEDDE
jgi:hypothetical protein